MCISNMQRENSEVANSQLYLIMLASFVRGWILVQHSSEAEKLKVKFSLNQF